MKITAPERNPPMLWVIQPNGVPRLVGACLALHRYVDHESPDRFGDIHGLRLGQPRLSPEVTLVIDKRSLSRGMRIVCAALRGAPLDFVIGLSDGNTSVENALRAGYGGARRRRSWVAFKFLADHTLEGSGTVGIGGKEIGPVTIYQKYQKQKRETPSESEVRLRMS